MMYRAVKNLPFDILDLCVLNATGQATVVLNDLESFDETLESYTTNYKLRFGEVLNNVKNIQKNKAIIDSFLNEDAGTSARDAKDAYDFLESLDPNIKKYFSIGFAISFPVSRIARLSELITIDIVKEYGIVLSRIGHPFDFSGDIPT